MLIMKIKIISPISFSIKLYKIAECTFLIFEHFSSRIFLKIASNIQFIKRQKSLFFIAKQFSFFTFFNIRSFYLQLHSLKKTLNSFFFKKLLLKGLGFKIISVVENQYLELKLGFSHFVKILIPKNSNLKLFINKNMIVIEGPIKSKVGNFANKIKSFRLPDSYKGKGIWYAKEVKVMKEIKKT